VFHEACLPGGCLNTIYHRPGDDAVTVTNALISSPNVKKVGFTNSTNVGSIIPSLTVKHLKPVVLKLGCNASFTVCEDADIKRAVLSFALGVFTHGGQICISKERILVHKEIATRFQVAMVETMREVFKGGQDGAPILVGSAAVKKNKMLLEDAMNKGAKALYGDVSTIGDTRLRMCPVIIENVKDDMEIYYTESFGPTVTLIIVDSDEEAVRVANDTE
jgi:acyl-CoA reductase-like NAD-dependent aldehyde dehydrogenase